MITNTEEGLKETLLIKEGKSSTNYTSSEPDVDHE
jgi:hypothetical protein